MPQDKGFNTKHPELRHGEMFLTNAFDNWSNLDDERSATEQFEDMSYKTKRRGNQLYDINGVMINGSGFPIFVQKSEYDEKMKKSHQVA